MALAENATARRARTAQRQQPALVLLDIWMPDTDGVTLLREWAASGQLTMPVVMMSGHGTIETAVEATKIGAFDFLEKPVGLQKLLGDDRARAQDRAGAGAAARFARGARQRAPRCATPSARSSSCSPRRSPMLILGEPGTGHDVAARALHAADAPCVALPDGARLTANPLALLEEARDGTLYCAEIGQYSKAEQKGLAFLLPQARQAQRDARVHEHGAARQPRRGGQVRRGAAGAAVRRRRDAAAAARAARGHPAADRALLARRRRAGRARTPRRCCRALPPAALDCAHQRATGRAISTTCKASSRTSRSCAARSPPST